MQTLLEIDPEPPPPPDPGPHPRLQRINRHLVLLIQVAGLLVGSWIFLVTTLTQHLHRYTWAGLVGHALRYAVLTWLWSATVTFLLYFTLPAEERRDMAWNTLRTSTVAVWFAPAILLVSELSPAALAAGLVLVVKATRLLYSQWRAIHPQPPLALAGESLSLFYGAELPGRPSGELGPAVTCACLAQFGAVALAMQQPLAAAALLVAGSSLLTIQATSRGAWAEERPTSLPRSFLGAFLTIVLASGLTVTGLRGRVVPGGGDGGSSVTGIRELLRQLMGRDQPSDEGPDQAAKDSKTKGKGNSDTPLPPPVPDPRTALAAGGTFPGVILRPEVQPVVTLVAPLTAVKHGFPSGAPARPFSIPFGGEYWMYRRLTINNRPPPNSLAERGSPSDLSFRTVDRWPLEMEAHQKLIQPIDLACCSMVQVEVSNADPAAQAVALELVAIGDGGAEQSLGMAHLNSRPDGARDPVTPVPETLDFDVPAAMGIGLAQEFKVVFRRTREHNDKSARIAIDRFLLVPRF